MIKKWRESLTIRFAGWLVVLGAVIQYLAIAQPDLTPFLGKWGGLVTVAIGIANVLLRLRTAGAIAGTMAAAREQVRAAVAEAPPRVVFVSESDERQGERAHFEFGGEPVDKAPVALEPVELPSHLRHPSRL